MESLIREGCWSSSAYLRSPADAAPCSSLEEASGRCCPLQLSYSGSSCSSLMTVLLASSADRAVLQSWRFPTWRRGSGAGLTFGQLQVEGVARLLHLAPGCHALDLVPQLLQLDVEVNFILRSRELCTAGTGRGHQITHLRGRSSQKRSGCRSTAAAPERTVWVSGMV